jgi:hypothetical protein
MIPTFLFLVAALTGTPPAKSASVCPEDHPKSREMLTRFLTRPSWQPDRDSIGFWTPVYASQIRLLTDATDAAACQRIIAAVGAPDWQPGWRWTAYQVNGLYFVAKRSVLTPGSHRFGFSPLFILNANFQVIRGAAL